MPRLIRPDGKLSKSYSREKLIEAHAKGNVPEGCLVVTDAGNVPIAEFCATPHELPDIPLEFVDPPRVKKTHPLRQLVRWTTNRVWARLLFIYVTLVLGILLITGPLPIDLAAALLLLILAPLVIVIAAISAIAKYISKSETWNFGVPTLLVSSGMLFYCMFGSWTSEAILGAFSLAVFLGTITWMISRQWRLQMIPIGVALAYSFWFMPFKVADDRTDIHDINFHQGLFSLPHKRKVYLSNSLSNFEYGLDAEGHRHGKATQTVWSDAGYAEYEEWYYHGEKCTRLEFDTVN
jgi:hypothetical protein